MAYSISTSMNVICNISCYQIYCGFCSSVSLHLEYRFHKQALNNYLLNI